MADSFDSLSCDVWTAAKHRVRIAYETYDNVVVSLSGGKDSTAALQATIATARELRRLPVEVHFFDEEAIPPETVEYVDRIRKMPEVSLKWFCIPLKARNACSATSPDWYPFHPEEKEIWVRPLPSGVITTHPHFRMGMDIATFSPHMLSRRAESTAIIMGIRMQESITRLRAITHKADPERAFLSPFPEHKNVVKCYPIYDWLAEDVWTAPERFGWDYNRAYDVMQRSGLSINMQRCSPAFGEQPIRGLHRFATCWPDLWERMIGRVPGAATAARYANTELYSGRGAKESDVSWKAKFEIGFARLSPDSREEVREAVRKAIQSHNRFTGDPPPDHEPHPETGLCWRKLYKAVLAGGNKFGRQAQKLDKDITDHRLKLREKGT